MAEPDPAPVQPNPEARPTPLSLADAAATRALGRQLAQELYPLCRPGTAPLLLLHGDLGAGKTCLVQGLAEELGIDEPITSPTFALAQNYQGQRPDGVATTLVHLDLYRLETGLAAEELFAQEEEEATALGALMAVEWPERLSFVPEGAWRLKLELTDPADPEAGRLAWLSGAELP
jgi:tRNA threonylcarbamoyladenosine biosynthesis protein TsaE